MPTHVAPSREKFDRLRAKYVAAYGKWMDQEVSLRARYGDGYQKGWVKAAEAKKLERLSESMTKASRAFVMDYLETLAPEDGFVCGDLAIDDIAVAVHFANLRWSRTGADLSPWPRTVAWIDRVESTPALGKLTELAARAMSTRNAERRALYGELGIALNETTFAGDVLRKGPMSV